MSEYTLDQIYRDYQWSTTTTQDTIMQQQKFTIKDLQDGRCSVINDGTVEELEKVLKAAFPKDPLKWFNKMGEYYAADISSTWRYCDKDEFPTQSVKVFIEGMNEIEGGKELAKVIDRQLFPKHYNAVARKTAEEFNEELNKEKAELATAIQEAKLFPSQWVADNLRLKEEPPLVTSFDTLQSVDPESDNTPSHYDNSKGSLYQFAEDHQLNAWEFEVCKRIVRCRKKGEWLSDIDKTIKVLELYKKEQGHLYEGQTEKLNK